MRRTGTGWARPTGALILTAAVGAGGCTSFAPAIVYGPAGPSPVIMQFKDAPPARVTGGFGEDSCHACHFGAAENDGHGRIQLSGFPERYTPGETYELELTVARAEMAAAGFQLAVRHADDMTQAGTVEVPPEEQRRVGVLSERGVLFAQQLLDGAELADSHTISWTVLWTAPGSGERVIAHAAAVAADGDDSQLGDHVYTLRAVADAEEPASP
jgi:hypothetical protein